MQKTLSDIYIASRPLSMPIFTFHFKMMSRLLSFLPFDTWCFFLSTLYSHSLLCHPVLKNAASFWESLVQAPALSSGLAVRVLLFPVASSTRGVEAECILQGEMDK